MKKTLSNKLLLSKLKEEKVSESNIILDNGSTDNIVQYGILLNDTYITGNFEEYKTTLLLIAGSKIAYKAYSAFEIGNDEVIIDSTNILYYEEPTGMY